MSKSENISKIICCAIQLFSERGYPNTSLREISQAAKVGLGTINFYFQSKESLFLSAVKKVVEDINKERGALLLEARHDGLTLEGVIAALVWPLVWRTTSLNPVERGKPYLLRWAMQGPGMVERRLTRLLDPTASDFVDAIQMILPEISRRDAFWGFSMAMSALYSRQLMDGRYDHLIDAVHVTEHQQHALHRTRCLIAFVTGGLRSLANKEDNTLHKSRDLNNRSASMLFDPDPFH